MTTRARTTLESAIEERVSVAQRAVDALRGRVQAAGRDIEHRFTRVVADLATSLDGVRDGLRLLRHANEDAWRTYEVAVDRAFDELESQIAVARAGLDIALAGNVEEFAAAVATAIDVWQNRVDDLRVQAALATMDVRQRMGPVLDRIESHMALVRGRLVEFRDARGDSATALELGVREAVEALRVSFDEALANLRSPG